MILGDLLGASGRHQEAARIFRLSLAAAESLSAEDPRNLQYQRDVSVALGRLAEAEFLSGRRRDAHATTLRALEMLRPLVQSPNASPYDLQQYTWILLTTPFPDLRNPAEALPFARKMVEMTDASDPGQLDLLARALFETGHRDEAIQTVRRALALAPPSQPGEVPPLRKQLEERLAFFERRGLPNGN
jgi:tetratricopeptide (TPR) repeat protein